MEGVGNPIGFQSLAEAEPVELAGRALPRTLGSEAGGTLRALPVTAGSQNDGTFAAVEAGPRARGSRLAGAVAAAGAGEVADASADRELVAVEEPARGGRKSAGEVAAKGDQELAGIGPAPVRAGCPMLDGIVVPSGFERLRKAEPVGARRTTAGTSNDVRQRDWPDPDGGDGHGRQLDRYHSHRRRTHGPQRQGRDAGQGERDGNCRRDGH